MLKPPPRVKAIVPHTERSVESILPGQSGQACQSSSVALAQGAFVVQGNAQNTAYRLARLFFSTLGAIHFDRTVALHYTSVGRARRGASGALHPQSAIAGSNGPSRGGSQQNGFDDAALKTGSRAAWAREPRQIREEAAVSGSPWVTRESLVGASDSRHAAGVTTTGDARPFFNCHEAGTRARLFLIHLLLKVCHACWSTEVPDHSRWRRACRHDGSRSRRRAGSSCRTDRAA